MKLKKKDDLPVYEAEIIDEDEYPKPVPAETAVPKRNLSYRIGKAVGSLAVLTGLYHEIRTIFRAGKPGDTGMGRGMGTGRGRGKGRRRNRKMRRII